MSCTSAPVPGERRPLTLNVKSKGDAELSLQGRVPHHAGEDLSLGVALRHPHVAHVHSGGAVGLLLSLSVTPATQIRLPENLRRRTPPLGYTGGHQRLVPPI